jgi:hypothetical protein
VLAVGDTLYIERLQKSQMEDSMAMGNDLPALNIRPIIQKSSGSSHSKFAWLEWLRLSIMTVAWLCY